MFRQLTLKRISDIVMMILAAGIHPKNWLCLLENSAENSNYPQKDCLRTQKLSILQCVKKRSTGIFEDHSELKSLAEQALGFRSYIPHKNGGNTPWMIVYARFILTQCC